MKKYTVSGMSCAACSARVEKAVMSVDGVTSCSVNLLTNSMGVEGEASTQKIIEAVKKAGYSAEVAEKSKEKTNKDNDAANEETKIIKNRLIVSLIFLLVLMYFSMGNKMLGLPLPNVINSNNIAIGIIQLLLSVTIMVINQRFFISGFKGLVNRAPNMDTLVALGSAASFVYSVFSLFAMTQAQVNLDLQAVENYSNEFYFESAAMILVLISVGKMLESRSKGKTTNALKSLMNLAPQKAVLLKNGVEIEVDATEINIGDVFVLRPGQSVPADGIIVVGATAFDESMLTGESMPVDKSEGDSVSAGTLNLTGFVRCEATKVGNDTVLSQIIKTVSDAAATKAPIAKIADKVSGVFVPIVILIAIITFIVWMIAGESVGFALARSVSVLVISCPCALGLATPVSIIVSNGVAAKHGILFKTAVSLENAGKIQIVALDKTGTITLGEPKVVDIFPVNGFSENELLELALSLELKSEHPIAKAIVLKSEELSIKSKPIYDFKSVTGKGISGKIDELFAAGGNSAYIESFCSIPADLKAKALEYSKHGRTPLWFVKDNSLVGLITVADVVKSDSFDAIQKIKNMGIRVVMLTGDNTNTAKAIGNEVGVDEVIAGVLPNEKEAVIRKLQSEGKVAMVGDGINDSPALTTADIGIAIGAGTDIAIDAADIVLLKSNLSDVSVAIQLSKSTLRNIKQNLFWAFIYNIIGIPLAAGAWYPLFGILLNPMFGAAAMSLSSFFVISNALRLNFTDVNNSKLNKSLKKNSKKEKFMMKKTVKIEGMMCPHCEARVKAVLESVAEIDSANVSHISGTAELILNSDLSDEAIKSVIEAQGYKVVD